MIAIYCRYVFTCAEIIVLGALSWKRLWLHCGKPNQTNNEILFHGSAGKKTGVYREQTRDYITFWAQSLPFNRMKSCFSIGDQSIFSAMKLSLNIWEVE